MRLKGEDDNVVAVAKIISDDDNGDPEQQAEE
jgi:hypothetical protein